MSGYDPAEVAAALGQLHAPDTVFEVRVLGSRFGTESGYFNDPAAAAAAIGEVDGKVPAVYVTLNPCLPDLLSRTCNRLQRHARETTRDDDILRRSNLLIDVDAQRPSGISATDEEHALALARTEAIRDYLCNVEGWPEPLVIDSGNGGHLWFAIDLPNNPESRQLVERVLKALHAVFSDDRVHVDTGVSNAARITKLPGTMVCKGDHTPERPHRPSCVVSAPATRQVVTTEQLRTVARRAPVLADHAAARNSRGTPLDLASWIPAHGVEVGKEIVSGEWRGWEIPTCPFNPEHDHGEAFVMQRSDGALSAGCHHDSCTWDWRDLRAKYDREYAERGSFNSGYSANTPWERPVLLDTPARLPVMPVDAFPDVVRGFIREIAESRQVPVDMPGMAGLGAIAIAAAGRYVAQLPTHAEPLNLYLLTGVDSGTRKSPVMSDATAPIYEVERDLCEAKRAEIAEARAAYEAAESRADHLRKQIGREQDPLERGVLQAELAQLHQTTSQPPTPPRLLVDDVTPERLTGLLAENRALGLMTSEGGPIGMMKGRYEKAGPNLDAYLKAHCGDPLRTDRASDPTNVRIVEQPALTLCIMAQPEVLTDLAGVQGGRGKGLIARFLFSLPECNLGRRFYRERPIDPVAQSRYRQCLRDLLLPPLPQKPRPIRPSREALAVWVAFHDSVEVRLGVQGDLRPIADWASKLAGAIARIAGGFHVVEHRAGRPEDVPISAATMQAAVSLGHYFIAHAKAAFALMEDSEEMKLARRIMGWIERHSLEEFSLADCHQDIRMERSSQLVPGLRLLEERNIIRPLAAPPKKGPGRPGSTRYAVNPMLAEALQPVPPVPSEDNFLNILNPSPHSECDSVALFDDCMEVVL